MKFTGLMKLELLSLNLDFRHVLVVDAKNHIMAHYVGEKLAATYPVSLSAKGIGCLENSNMTPHGVHTICEKYGEDAPEGMIFENREATGEIWQVGDERDNLITSRILRLKGEIPGINKGPKVDSYDRYIYIHGTNREDAIGKTDVSHGCILMTNSDIIRLYDKVQEGCVVFINK